ncbi:MAG: hypothetical protein WKF84_15745 [Pyrinomonadaceae bacterium]
MILEKLGGDPPQRMIAVPLVARNKVAAVLYADSAGLGPEAINLEALESLVRVAGMSVELLASKRPGTSAEAVVAAPAAAVAPAEQQTAPTPIKAPDRPPVNVFEPEPVAAVASPPPAVMQHATPPPAIALEKCRRSLPIRRRLSLPMSSKTRLKIRSLFALRRKTSRRVEPTPPVVPTRFESSAPSLDTATAPLPPPASSQEQPPLDHRLDRPAGTGATTLVAD